MIQNSFISELESTPIEEIKRRNHSGYYHRKSHYAITMSYPYITESQIKENVEFVERSVIYRIGNRESINCSCGCHRGFINEYEYDDNIIQNTVCMLCSAVVNVERIQGDINVDEKELLNFLWRF